MVHLKEIPCSSGTGGSEIGGGGSLATLIPSGPEASDFENARSKMALLCRELGNVSVWTSALAYFRSRW